MSRLLRSLLPFSFLLAACATFDTQQSQILLRYRPEADVLDVLIVHEGIRATGDPRDVERAAEALQGMGAGRRHFLVWGLMEWDVDRFAEEQREEPIDPGEQDAAGVRALFEYQSNVSVVEARLLLDQGHEGRLCLLQRLRLEQGSRLLRILDGWLNAMLLEEASGEDDEDTDKERTDRLQLARAKAGGSWARFDGSALVVSIPMSAEYAAEQLRGWLTSAASERSGDKFEVSLLDSLTSFQVTGEEMRLTFGPAKDGWIHLRLPGCEDYDAAVAGILEQGKPLVTEPLAPQIERMQALP